MRYPIYAGVLDWIIRLEVCSQGYYVLNAFFMPIWSGVAGPWDPQALCFGSKFSYMLKILQIPQVSLLLPLSESIPSVRFLSKYPLQLVPVRPRKSAGLFVFKMLLSLHGVAVSCLTKHLLPRRRRRRKESGTTEY